MTLVSSFSRRRHGPGPLDRAPACRCCAPTCSTPRPAAPTSAPRRRKPALNPFEISCATASVAAGIPLDAAVRRRRLLDRLRAPHPTSPGEMVLAIEADGADATTPTQHRPRPRPPAPGATGALGWAFQRVWSREWETGRPDARGMARARRWRPNPRPWNLGRGLDPHLHHSPCSPVGPTGTSTCSPSPVPRAPRPRIPHYAGIVLTTPSRPSRHRLNWVWAGARTASAPAEEEVIEEAIWHELGFAPTRLPVSMPR